MRTVAYIDAESYVRKVMNITLPLFIASISTVLILVKNIDVKVFTRLVIYCMISMSMHELLHMATMRMLKIPYKISLSWWGICLKPRRGISYVELVVTSLTPQSITVVLILLTYSLHDVSTMLTAIVHAYASCVDIANVFTFYRYRNRRYLIYVDNMHILVVDVEDK